MLSTNKQKNNNNKNTEQPKKKLKLQTSLHSFLGLADHRVPQYFHLDWENKQAVYMDQVPVGVNWKSSFVWKQEKQEVVVCLSLRDLHVDKITA